MYLIEILNSIRKAHIQLVLIITILGNWKDGKYLLTKIVFYLTGQ